MLPLAEVNPPKKLKLCTRVKHNKGKAINSNCKLPLYSEHINNHFQQIYLSGNLIRKMSQINRVELI